MKIVKNKKGDIKSVRFRLDWEIVIPAVIVGGGFIFFIIMTIVAPPPKYVTPKEKCDKIGGVLWDYGNAFTAPQCIIPKDNQKDLKS